MNIDFDDFDDLTEVQEEYITDWLDTHTPDWCRDIDSGYDLAAIAQGGCASGAYMPAVTYHTAKAVMGSYGDSIMEYIESQLGEIPAPNEGESWSGLAVHYYSTAVELFVSSAIGALELGLED